MRTHDHDPLPMWIYKRTATCLPGFFRFQEYPVKSLVLLARREADGFGHQFADRTLGRLSSEGDAFFVGPPALNVVNKHNLDRKDAFIASIQAAYDRLLAEELARRALGEGKT